MFWKDTTDNLAHAIRTYNEKYKTHLEQEVPLTVIEKLAKDSSTKDLITSLQESIERGAFQQVSGVVSATIAQYKQSFEVQ